MTIRKKILVLFHITVVLLCPDCMPKEQPTSKEESKKLVIALPKSPVAVPVFYIKEKKTLQGIDIQIDLYNSMEGMMAMASDPKYRIIGMPLHCAANFYNKGCDLHLLTVFNWGGLSLASTDKTVNRIEDLKGKKLYVPSRGSVPDMFTLLFLNDHGLVPGKNITVIYSNHVEIARLLEDGKISNAVDVEPFISRHIKKLDSYHIVAVYNKQWKARNGKGYEMPGFGLVVKKGSDHIDTFSRALQQAITAINKDPALAGKLAGQFIGADECMISDAVPGFNFKYVSPKKLTAIAKHYYSIVIDLNPGILGEKIPDEKFYNRL